MREGTYLEIVDELPEGHLLAVGLDALHLEAIPQRPVDFVILRPSRDERERERETDRLVAH